MKNLANALLLTFLTLINSACSQPTIDTIDSQSTILAFGDSLTKGYGAKPEASYPSQLAKILNCQVINAGVNGQQTAAGLKRLPEALKQKPDLVILCFGGNDLLRKKPHATIKANLAQMIELIQAQDADIILLGVPSPNILLKVPSFYQELADEYQVVYYESLIPKILGKRQFKSDYIHPNTKGYRIIAEQLAKVIKKQMK